MLDFVLYFRASIPVKINMELSASSLFYLYIKCDGEEKILSGCECRIYGRHGSREMERAGVLCKRKLLS